MRPVRTADDRARDRAINRAIAQTGKQSGPIIVRLGQKKPQAPASKQATLPKPADPSSFSMKSLGAKKQSNTTLADALMTAGVIVKKKQLSNGKPRKAKIEDPQESVPKPKATKSRKRKRKRKLAKSVIVQKVGIGKRTKRQKKLLAALRTTAADPDFDRKASEIRWQRRQKEIAVLIDEIKNASFSDLATEWKRHVGLVGYIEETGQNAGRLPAYGGLIAAIEREWGRRAGMHFNSDEYFDWPSTRAGRSQKGAVNINWAKEGFLSYLGYHADEKSDLTDHARQAILRRTFKMVLPPLESPNYVRSWGAPSSSARLKKIAYSLASFARLARPRNAGSSALAVARWEKDLAVLREEYYVAKFGFGWPSI